MPVEGLSKGLHGTVGLGKQDEKMEDKVVKGRQDEDEEKGVKERAKRREGLVTVSDPARVYYPPLPSIHAPLL